MCSADRQAEKLLANAGSYAEWLDAATNLDRIEGNDGWREKSESADYDYRLIASRTTLLRGLQRSEDYDQLVFRLREELHGNLGNMANPVLYQRARSGTKLAISGYLDAVTTALFMLCDSNVPALPPSRKRRFFNRAARSFGRSAMLLSGGGSLGLFHIGVVTELLEQALLPQVLTGSSAGSIVAGFLATHSDTELKHALEPDELKYRWLRTSGLGDVLRGQGVLDLHQLRSSINRNIPQLTFLEAYEKTGRILNISVSPSDSHQFPRLLNYLSSPNVLIRQAALASSAIPGLFPPVQLRARNYNGRSVPYVPQSRWIDGSVHEDIPKEKVNRLHNVNHYIVSQVNPHIVPFLSEEAEKTGLLPFLHEIVTRGPMVQVEHVLDLVQRHFDVPGLSSIVRKAHAIVGQNYSGDITIYPGGGGFSVSQVFENFKKDDARQIIEAGRRATWPKIERIRNTTRISRTFTDCLDRLAKRYHYAKL